MALMLSTLGFQILATEGTHRTLTLNGIDSEPVLKHTVGLEMRAATRSDRPEAAAADVITSRRSHRGRRDRPGDQHPPWPGSPLRRL